METYDETPELYFDVPLTMFEAAQAKFNFAERLHPHAIESVTSSGKEQLTLVQDGEGRLGVILQRPPSDDGAPEELTVEVEERHKVNSHSSLQAIRFWRYYAIRDTDNDGKGAAYELRYKDGEQVRRELDDREKLRIYDIIATSSIRQP